jgi:chemotaxis protein methyltransferase CheR
MMIGPLDRAVLGAVTGLIAERMGLAFPEESWPDVARSLDLAGRELGFDDLAGALRWLRQEELTARQVETLASHLTVGETYFLRDPASFEALEREILPQLAASRSEAGRTLRLWSAGCCSGEEAYSLAITCARALPDLSTWNVSILATDINPQFLARARAGVYREWSFRGAPEWLRERFFSPAPGGTLAIDPTVKSLVHFGELNLAVDDYPSPHNQTTAMDVIFCRNVLMYFTAEHQRRVVEALHRCLMDGGYLVVSAAEASSPLFSVFAAESIGGGITIYRRTSPPALVESLQAPVSPAIAPAGPMPEPVAIAARSRRLPGWPFASGRPAMPRSLSAPIPGSPGEAPLVLARAYANQGRLVEALTSCQEAVAIERTNPVAHFLYATICHELGLLEDAIASLRTVLYLDQDFILAHHELGGLYGRLGRRKESRRHLAVALELLSARSRDEIVAESGGMTCGRLAESVRAMTGA